MSHINCLSYSRHLVNFPAIVENVGVISDFLAISLEVHYVDFIKSYQSDPKPDISLSELLANEVSILGEDFFYLVKSIEQVLCSFFVSLLLLGKSASVDSVVDIRIDELIDLVNFLS